MSERLFPSAAEILAADDLPSEDVPVPEWGVNAVVRIRTLSGLERDAFEQSCFERQGADIKENRANVTARLVAAAAVDLQCARLFTPEQTIALGQKNAKALNRCYAAAARLAGLSRADREELAGNSDAGQSESSTSASPGTSAAPSANS